MTRTRIPFPGKASLVLRAAALALFAVLLGSCADPDPAPSGVAEILAAWDGGAGDGSLALARITIRVACSGELAAERFGATVRVDTDRRRYWASIEEVFFLPVGASTTRTIDVPFAEADERIKPGSAAVESFWFE